MDKWTTLAPLPLPHGHIAASTLVMNGRIVTVGGATNGDASIADVFEYDPATNAWTALPPIPAGRRSPVAGVVGNQLVVTTGDPGTISGTTNTWVGTLANSWE